MLQYTQGAHLACAGSQGLVGGTVPLAMDLGEEAAIDGGSGGSGGRRSSPSASADLVIVRLSGPAWPVCHIRICGFPHHKGLLQASKDRGNVWHSAHTSEQDSQSYKRRVHSKSSGHYSI